MSIPDHGEGIAKSEWQNVFKPFYRLRTSQNKTGSGLALVAQIAKRHGGTAEIVQKQDLQSSICIILPSI